MPNNDSEILRLKIDEIIRFESTFEDVEISKKLLKRAALLQDELNKLTNNDSIFKNTKK